MASNHEKLTINIKSHAQIYAWDEFNARSINLGFMQKVYFTLFSYANLQSLVDESEKLLKNRQVHL